MASTTDKQQREYEECSTETEFRRRDNLLQGLQYHENFCYLPNRLLHLIHLCYEQQYLLDNKNK